MLLTVFLHGLQAELMDVDDQVEHKRARDGADSSSDEQEQQQQQVRGSAYACTYVCMHVEVSVLAKAAGLACEAILFSGYSRDAGLQRHGSTAAAQDCAELGTEQQPHWSSLLPSLLCIPSCSPAAVPQTMRSLTQH